MIGGDVVIGEEVLLGFAANRARIKELLGQKPKERMQ